MLERDLDVPPGIDAVRPIGTLTQDDHDEVVVPLLDAAAREHRRLRLLCVVDEAFTGTTPGAVWDDLWLGLRALPHLAGCAVVSDVSWVRAGARLAGFVLPVRIRVFPAADRAGALAWLADLPGDLARVRTAEEGVVVAELREPLRREDVDQIASEVEDWLAAHPGLPGLVLHAPAFPGWEDLAGLLSHLRFVAGHQSHIERVALVLPGPGVERAAGVVGSVLHPEIRRFDDLDAAVRWAAAAPVKVG